jgi:hypothetical protein
MSSYYKLSVKLTPGWRLPHPKSLKLDPKELKGGVSDRAVDPKLWADVPHVAFANLGYDPQRRAGVATDDQIRMFTTQYGPLGAGGNEEAATVPQEPFWLSLANFRFLQVQLREAWTKRDASQFTDPANLAMGHELLPMSLKVKGGILEMQPASLYAYMGILLARDIAEGCARVCQNRNCHTPFFIAKRSDQLYCSHPCAVAINVEKFRQRQVRKRSKKNEREPKRPKRSR